MTGAGRALGIVLIRLGISEINQHAVAHILGDKTAKAADGVGHAAMVGADDLAQVLGIVGWTEALNRPGRRTSRSAGAARPLRRKPKRSLAALRGAKRMRVPSPLPNGYPSVSGSDS
jgi:hypothetical protein